jgi:hypothetical protein
MELLKSLGGQREMESINGVIQVRFINIKGMEPWELCHWEIFSPIVTPIEGSITKKQPSKM